MVIFSKDLKLAMAEYFVHFKEYYPIVYRTLSDPKKDAAEIRRRIAENDPAPPLTQREKSLVF